MFPKMKLRETSGLEGKQNLGKKLGKGCGKGGGEMRGKGGCEEKVDRERKGTRRECHAYNTVQGGFVQGPPF